MPNVMRARFCESVQPFGTNSGQTLSGAVAWALCSMLTLSTLTGKKTSGTLSEVVLVVTVSVLELVLVLAELALLPMRATVE